MTAADGARWKRGSWYGSLYSNGVLIVAVAAESRAVSRSLAAACQRELA